MDVMHIYTVHITWSDEDKGFIAIVPQLKGCSAFGTTMEEAAREIQDAMTAWIEAAKMAGNTVPAPLTL
jgi:antitoxin HicB